MCWHPGFDFTFTITRFIRSAGCMYMWPSGADTLIRLVACLYYQSGIGSRLHRQDCQVFYVWLETSYPNGKQSQTLLPSLATPHQMRGFMHFAFTAGRSSILLSKSEQHDGLQFSTEWCAFSYGQNTMSIWLLPPSTSLNSTLISDISSYGHREFEHYVCAACLQRCQGSGESKNRLIHIGY